MLISGYLAGYPGRYLGPRLFCFFVYIRGIHMQKYYGLHGIFIIILTGRTSSRRRNIPQNIPCIDQSCCRKEWPTKQFGSSILLLLLLLPRQQHQSLLFPTIFFVLHLLSQTFTRTTNRKQELPLPTSLLNLPNATFSASLGN